MQATQERGGAAVDTAVCDVAVIGAGPAGSTIATLLARRGYRVLVYEKDRHPRFHIGESLLPLNLELFERLGVADQVAKIGMVKRAAEFNSVEHGKTVQFSFADAFDCHYPYAYQVRRSEFDAMLVENARANGAQVFEGWRATGVEFGRNEVAVDVAAPDGTPVKVRARYLVDASGRDTFLAGKFGIKRRNVKHSSAALYGHFRGARRSEGADQGNISIYWFAHGWFWFIPLADGTTSVGAVCWPYYLKTRRSDPSTFLRETIALSPALAERLRDAEMIAPATATGNYSYTSDRMSGDRYIMVGDAFAFIDPVFSSGVYLAMKSSFLAAEVVQGVLSGTGDARQLNAQFDRTVRRGLRRFSWMIYRMTNPAMRDLLMNPHDVLGVKRAIIALLAGDVYRYGPVWWRLMFFRVLYYGSSLRSLGKSFTAWRRRRAAIVPQPIQATDGSG
jgi:flavin-dependent dehydrogenase